MYMYMHVRVCDCTLHLYTCTIFYDVIHCFWIIKNEYRSATTENKIVSLGRQVLHVCCMWLSLTCMYTGRKGGFRNWSKVQTLI